MMTVAISTSISNTERLEAIEKAKETFQHDLQNIHNDELSSGADAALTKHLTYLVHFQAHRNEIALTCHTLESLYRASSNVVGLSYQRLGDSLTTLLKTIVDQEIDRRSTSSDDDLLDQEADDEVGDMMLRAATKVLGHFARVGDATEPLAHHPGLIATLIALIPCDIPWEARLSAVWILANLACNAKNMVMMVQTDQLVQCLVDVASRIRNANDSVEEAVEKLRSKSISSRAILNLSWDAANKETLSQNPSLLDLLCTLSVHRTDSMHRSRTVLDILVNMRRHAVGALRNLAAAPRKFKIALCDYKDGVILDVLTDATLNDGDQNVKDRAFAAIHNLAVHDTATLIISRPALVLALKDVLVAADDSDTTRSDGTPKEHASATLMVLERSITPGMQEYSQLRDLLDEIKAHKTEKEGMAIRKDVVSTSV